MAKRKRFKWVKWLFLLVFLAAAVAGAVFLVKNNFDNKTDDSSRQTKESDNKETEKEETGEDGAKDAPKNEDKAPQYDGDSPNKSETLTGLMSYADVINEELVIRVSIDQFLQSGTCNLAMTRNGATYHTQSVGIVESVTTSTCDGFKIPVSELPKGELRVEIDLESDGKSGRIEGRVKI